MTSHLPTAHSFLTSSCNILFALLYKPMFGGLRAWPALICSTLQQTVTSSFMPPENNWIEKVLE